MSKLGKIGKCSVCGQEKTIFYDWASESRGQSKHYCKECYDFSKEKVKCEKCDQDVMREFLADHFRDYHSEL